MGTRHLTRILFASLLTFMVGCEGDVGPAGADGTAGTRSLSRIALQAPPLAFSD